TPMVWISGGSFLMGSNDRHGYDNEKQAHAVKVAPFELEVHPVTAAAWLAFIRDGGYYRKEWWTKAGWAWRQREEVKHPEYWVPVGDGFGTYAADGIRPLHPEEPVSSLSWYEADAYARRAGKRLPTEAEWEFAAACDPALQHKRCYSWGDDPSPVGHADCEIHRWIPAPVGQETTRNA